MDECDTAMAAWANGLIEERLAYLVHPSEMPLLLSLEDTAANTLNVLSRSSRSRHWNVFSSMPGGLLMVSESSESDMGAALALREHKQHAKDSHPAAPCNSMNGGQAFFTQRWRPTLCAAVHIAPGRALGDSFGRR